MILPLPSPYSNVLIRSLDTQESGSPLGRYDYGDGSTNCASDARTRTGLGKNVRLERSDFNTVKSGSDHSILQSPVVRGLHASLNSYSDLELDEFQKTGLKYGSEMVFNPIQTARLSINPADILRTEVRDLTRTEEGHIEVTMTWTRTTLNIKTIDNRGRSEVDLFLTLSEDRDQWRGRTTHGLPLAILSSADVNDLMFLVRGIWIIRSYHSYKYNSQREKAVLSESVNPLLVSVKSRASKPVDDVQSDRKIHCVNHDLLCTLPPILDDTLRWLGINVHLSGHIQYGGGVANMLDCCKQHDVNLWCSQYRQETARPVGDKSMTAVTADIEVIFCMLDRLAQNSISTSFLGGLVTGAYFWAVYGPMALLAVTLAPWSADAHSQALLNLDGRNSNSCLCGGSEPTVLCNDKCRDLCREFGRKVLCNQNCSYSCDYDKRGRLTSKQRQIINNSTLPCCPTSIRPCKEPKPCDNKNCVDCKWYCQKCGKFDWNCPGGYKAYYGKEYLGSFDSRKCCPDRDSPEGPGSQPYSERITCRNVPDEKRDEGGKPSSDIFG